MDEIEKTKIAIIPDYKHPLVDERENEITHTSFNEELKLFGYIMNGDVEKVRSGMEDYFSHGLVMGKMSGNSLRQIQYWAVSSIAVAVHYAILGGLDETDAFNMSDECIRYIDTSRNIEEILPYLYKKAIQLTEKVFSASAHKINSALIKECLHYIHINLNKKIRVTDLAKIFKLSVGYLSVLFCKETGMSIKNYIIREKLKAAKDMLLQGISYSDITYNLSFCSESHFISCFHKMFGITPGEFVSSKRV